MSVYKEVEGQGQDVVILHGWNCDSRHMQPIVDQLSNSYRVTTIDLPGCGKSIWQEHIKTIHDIADIIQPHLPENAIYIPWSFSGLVTFSIAAQYPERVKRIVGIGITPKFIEAENWLGVPAPGFQVDFTNIKSYGVSNFMRDFFNSEFSGFNPKPPIYQQLMQIHNATPEQDPETILKGVYMADQTDVRNEFQQVRCPIDLILGEQDSAVPLATYASMKALNPNVNFHVIPGAHHMPFWTHPVEFQNILRSILGERD
jgi:pimeloyl-[acyl-carrier protein] methyl ester esterase